MSQDQQVDPYLTLRGQVLDAALPLVPFDGWCDAVLREAITTSGVDTGQAHLAFPRGALDLALAFHRRGDRQLADDPGDLQGLGMTAKIGHCVLRRIELVAPHREAVRRGAALFALPMNAPDGARAIWETADTIWTCCGDSATDYNWYTKRAILGSVYSATVLYWLGDMDPEMAPTRAFLDRRLTDVMRFEKTKAKLRDNPLARALLWGPRQVLSQVRAPSAR